MTVRSRLIQRPQQSLGFRQIQAVNLLRLSNEDLTADLARRAAANPFLRLRLPAAPGFAGDEPASAAEGLYAHVLAQLRLIRAAREDEPLALAFVEALDGNGWLDRPVAAIAAGLGRSLAAAEAMLGALQQAVEPVGLFARDLADCLRLQAVEREVLTPALAAVLDRLDLLATGAAAAVAAASGFAAGEIAQALAQIRRLDPRPGRAFASSATPIRAPDVIVSRAGPDWRIELNRSTLPELRLAPANVTANVTDREMGGEMRAIRAEAEWLANLVERRNRTVLAVSRAVLMRQRGFLDHGPRGLLSLTRFEIAVALGLHDSTVGRVARDLLVETPHGLRSLCSLFSSRPAGTEKTRDLPAAEALRLRLAQLVAAEDPRAPLDDAALAEILGREGASLARRTIAKYRDQLGIAPSHQRRARS
ncbi:RNA polymerase factor sigma-54 [Paracoccus aminophilus]|uniref:RNA polymerase sigma-54 factor n=1 Tax=Paracoccus aminophilus JCM 7686 TaxID=1367847 RepID=S5Y038_PARAH|nr:RNA polymerase sigma-54 factor [Paracoccus aminophilus]AGT10907.1 RNA polymerase sigma-54 factor [Paracoccus aminophilus JCM 7686]